MALSSTQKLRPAVVPTPWTLDEVAGRFVEISGAAASAALTLTFTLIREAQARGEPVGWVTLAEHSFYPPDAAQGGTDLAALVVVRLARADSIARAGEKLLRSGGFRRRRARSRRRRYTDAAADALDRPGPSSSHGADLSDGKNSRRLFSRFAGFLARPCREEALSGQSLRLRSARAQGQTARPHLDL